MIDTIEKSKCVGCKMCADICPRNAISFSTDDKGFWYPVVDYKKCVKCGICTKKCPSLHFEEPDKYDYPEVFALWNKDEEIRISSTSGGAFWGFASKIIEEGGVVVGSVYQDDWRSAKHVIATTLAELVALKGSKYFQSDTEGIYQRIEQYLIQGTVVLFCGTPCQNAALSNFLDKDYENLIKLDFICRSINSPLAFKAYIDELERLHESKVVEVQLKNKELGWQSLASKVVFENGKESLKDRNSDWWVKGFIYNDLYTRDSCFNCKYRKIPRTTADITIGDFWGIKGVNHDEMFKGVSAVLINSSKGATLFKKCSSIFDYQRRDIDDLLPGNPALLKSPVDKNNNSFFSFIKTYPFSESVKKCIGKSKLSVLKSKVFAKMRTCGANIKLMMRSDVSAFKFLHYNYFSKHIVRQGKARIIPFKNAIIDLRDDSKIILSGDGDLRIGINKLKHSKAETHVRMNGNAIWKCKNGADLFYNVVLEVKNNAVLETGYFSANGGSVIIADEKIVFGEDVMIGRNVIVYDSDFHTIRSKKGIPSNYPKPVIIEDHVWLTSNINVQKGVRIGKGSLIASQTTISRDVPEHSIVGGGSKGEVISDKIEWDRKMCPKQK